jgi:hypothetical protein
LLGVTSTVLLRSTAVELGTSSPAMVRINQCLEVGHINIGRSSTSDAATRLGKMLNGTIMGCCADYGILVAQVFTVGNRCRQSGPCNQAEAEILPQRSKPSKSWIALQVPCRFVGNA